jgi:hypothetical protein
MKLITVFGKKLVSSTEAIMNWVVPKRKAVVILLAL